MDLQIRARLDPVEAGGGGSASVDIGSTKWLRRGRLFSKEHETETTVDWLKEELAKEPAEANAGQERAGRPDPAWSGDSRGNNRLGRGPVGVHSREKCAEDPVRLHPLEL